MGLQAALHILKFLGVSEDAIKLRHFPYTLQDKGKRWFNTLPKGSITSWELLKTGFLDWFYLEDYRDTLKNDSSPFGKEKMKICTMLGTDSRRSCRSVLDMS